MATPDDLASVESLRNRLLLDMTSCFIGLGSNLAAPLKQIHRALDSISQLTDTQLVQASSLYASKPMGPQDQPDYVNAVVKIETRLAPHDLLSQLQKIELSHGRERKDQRWGPRTLDLDIILYGDQEIQTESLTIPHYGMKTREFVLYPLHEIAPELLLPCGNSLISVLNRVSRNELQIIATDVI